MKKLKETRGDFTINGAFILLLVFLLLALAISVFGVINRSMKLHSMAAELVRYAEVRGQVDSAVYGELDRLERVTGVNVDCTITADYIRGTSRVQFGDSISVHLEYDTYFGVGGLLSVPITLPTPVAGRSELYWK